MAQAGARRDPGTGAVSMPIHMSAAFQHQALGRSTGFDYSRTANPSRQALEQTMSLLEGGAGCLAFASGLAALDAALRLFEPGARLVVTEDLYGGSFRLFEKFGRPQRLDFIYVDTSDSRAVADALEQPGVRGLFVEMPTNPLLKVADLRALGRLAGEKGALFMVDNTFMTPACCRPMEYGADLVLYSATKYLGGHNDLLAGLAVSRTRELAERLAFIQNATGAVLGPWESWLLLRSLKTLSLRMKKHEENALAVASFLRAHPKVGRVYYPGLPEDAGYALLGSQAQGRGGMISFEVESRTRVESILSSVRVFLFAESLGGAESLVTYPIVQTHADMEAGLLARLGLNDRLLRLSIGLEDAEDLLEDLAAVLD